MEEGAGQGLGSVGGFRGQRSEAGASVGVLGDVNCESDDGAASEVDDVVDGDHLQV